MSKAQIKKQKTENKDLIHIQKFTLILAYDLILLGIMW